MQTGPNFSTFVWNLRPVALVDFRLTREYGKVEYLAGEDNQLAAHVDSMTLGPSHHTRAAPDAAAVCAVTSITGGLRE
ncbi:hypothetical protein FB45DRAFT_1033473 [Roridomyces roridus]|uniref:Uncharacterized protein n=1 Tax=Roridomyces roridus TaxID=1738132 RepID=A0AAD7BFF5_9AGAR|nr:hypothetical protein FB45DRAFT_1033473 [Roridomyces roridus]